MEVTPLTWRKSRRSTAQSANCVEAAPGKKVAVRDSKNPDGPRLSVSAAAWKRFANSVK